jgi:hypothetical protein
MLPGARNFAFAIPDRQHVAGLTPGDESRPLHAGDVWPSLGGVDVDRFSTDHDGNHATSSSAWKNAMLRASAVAVILPLRTVTVPVGVGLSGRGAAELERADGRGRRCGRT